MSISGSLSNALSGLTASSRAAELVSSNVANAMTEGYARRELSLSARVTGGVGSGVAVDGVTRAIDEIVVRDRRLADAGRAAADTTTTFFADFETLLGTPGKAGSLSALMSGLETALIEASSRPDLQARLESVARAAQDLTRGFNAASSGIQTLRRDADASIARVVASTNLTLERIAEVNALVLRNGGAGLDMPALLDQRDRLIDTLAEVVPLRVLPRDDGTVAIYSMGGAALLDGRPATVGFTSTATIVPDMTVQSGALSGLTINGQPVRVTGDNAPMAGGLLSALFAVRDELAVTAQAQLDSVARDLLERVADPAVDPTLTPGAAGLFTDLGAAFDPANEVGLAGRLSVNALVLPDQGGELWRLRDGVGAVAPAEPGSNRFLMSIASALLAERVPASGNVTISARSASGLLGELSSIVGSSLHASASAASYRTAQADALRQAQAAGGVDTDLEMQKLLLIEQSYAANAQVIRTVDELIQLLLGI